MITLQDMRRANKPRQTENQRTAFETKEHHPALPKHPGKQLKDWPPQQIVGYCGSCIIAPLRAAPAATTRFTGVRPVIGSGPKEPHHHYCAIGSTRSCLLIRQPLLRELTVFPRWGTKALE
ncbi:hypothetical protein AVEN_35847-1 [Araneus ventricosus]|uniref:Uncharacterized protein n=1 Tax=Araneus ventricosus TaxID=182803 RepID=A0A4Y2BJ50_ARAVE|nr:hypothetical protein AVEN_35847-1 [Araneus ventricosus]